MTWPGVAFVEEDFRRIGTRLVDVAERHPENGDKGTRQHRERRIAGIRDRDARFPA